MEIHPSSFAPAKFVRRITDQSGLIGLEVQERNGKTYKLLVNDTSGVVDLSESFKDMRADALVIGSGESYRLPFLPAMAAKQTKSLGKLAELATLSNLLDVEGRDSKEASAKEDDEPDSKLLLKPYRHKVIVSGTK